MNKLVTVLGVAAVATLAGCKDPNYKPMSDSSQDDVMVVGPAEPQSTPAPVLATPSCKCPPGTRHVAPCACGAADCQCIVEVKPVAVPTPPPVEPAYTTYIVQNGDYLAKISKKFNVTISSIKRINGLKSDVIRVGQKLKLPGKLDVGVQKAPVVSSKAPKAASASAEYKGATKEYVVKGGDTLGAIAYSNGINVRQLKKLNGLTSDVVKVGQKLKVPAAGKAAVAEKKPKPEVVKAAPKAPTMKTSEPAKAVAPAALAIPPAAPAPVAEKPAVEESAPVEAAPATEAAPAAPADAATTTYVVQESDDMTGVTIRFGVTAAAIRELNNLSEDAQLTPGQIIKLPADAQQ